MLRAVVLCLAALALIASGCGGTSKEDYEEEIDAVGQQLDEEFTDIGRELQMSGGLEKAAPELRRGASALDEAVDDLEGLEPPDDAEKAHDKIVEGVRLLARDFRSAAPAAARGDVRRVLQLFGSIESSRGYRLILEARDDLRDAGYDVSDG